MPVLSGSTVNVQPMSSRSRQPLSDLRDILASMPPDFARRAGGWASTDDEGSNLGGVGVAPPRSEPTLSAAASATPEVLHARYYFWNSAPSGLSSAVQDLEAFRRLDAIDVLIWRTSPDRISVVCSSRNRTLLHRRDGVVKSLEAALQVDDASIRIDRHTSAISLLDADIFLWLAVRAGDATERILSPRLSLDQLAGVSASDFQNRPADLRSGIDFERPAFLAAVAESDVLGPLRFSFTVDTYEGRSSFELNLHVDGGFEIHKSGIHYPEVMADALLTRRASYDLLFDCIPELNSIYRADLGSWRARRLNVIESAIGALQTRYERALQGLRDRLDNPPAE